MRKADATPCLTFVLPGQPVKRLQHDGEGALTLPTNAEWVGRFAFPSGFTDFLCNER